MKIKSTILQISICCLIIAVTAGYLLKGDGLEVFLRTLRRISAGSIALMFFLLLSYILLESVIIKVILGALEEQVSMRQCIRYSFLGFFFYCITPAGSGEQPMQLLAMHRDGLSAPKCVYALTLITITFKLSIVMLALGAFCIRGQAMISMLGPIVPFVIIGIILSVLCILAFAGLLWAPEIVERVMRWALALLSKLGVIKNREKFDNKITSFMAKYIEALGIGRSKRSLLLTVIGITAVQRSCLFAITGIAGIATGHYGIGILDATFVQAMIQLATEMLPLPGGTGLSEIFFMKVFGGMYGGDSLSVLMLSRGMSFYAQIAVCGIASLGFAISERIKKGTRIGVYKK